MGEVHDGEAVMDWMPQEQERGITITSAVTTCSWLNHEIHIIDTPGHVDFTIEVERSLRILDGAVVVFCAVGGVEPQSETVWHQADKYHVPKVAFINKMDRVGADYFGAIRMMSERFNSKPLPVQIPWGQEENFNGVIDLIRRKLLTWDPATLGLSYAFSDIPEDIQPQVEAYREEMLETLAELDDDFADRYLEGMPLSEKDILDAVRKTTLTLKAVPVMCGSALRNKGVQPVLQRRQPGAPQQPPHLLLQTRATQRPVQRDRLRHLPPDAVQRVQRGHRLLEDHRDIRPAHALHLCCAQLV